ncbi:MAG TPA: hypothetical protein PLG28_04730, partial [Bacillota bacterium]|nr:hypothetical protein [Bacillota bacterium]HOK64853.1 hypothetical protein [Bacillota bacterium]HPP61019.1 hypothetical protein [Bacillota bacterium]HPZ78443.1 hypothetical protein [Bacillota bacterium]HQD74626.1 hypothetical protein [Bacillota bacterium]
ILKVFAWAYNRANRRSANYRKPGLETCQARIARLIKEGRPRRLWFFQRPLRNCVRSVKRLNQLGNRLAISRN